MVGDALLDVGEDLRLRRVAPAPVELGLEGKRIEVRGYVAGRTGVVVVAPGDAGLGVLLEDQEVVLAPLTQFHRQAEAGEAGTDDQHAQVRLLGSLVGHCCLREPPVLRIPGCYRLTVAAVYGIVSQKIVTFGQPMARPRRSAVSVQLLTQYGLDLGLSLDTCLQGTGLDWGLLADPGAEVDAEQELRLVRNLVQACGHRP